MNRLNRPPIHLVSSRTGVSSRTVVPSRAVVSIRTGVGSRAVTSVGVLVAGLMVFGGRPASAQRTASQAAEASDVSAPRQRVDSHAAFESIRQAFAEGSDFFPITGVALTLLAVGGALAAIMVVRKLRKRREAGGGALGPYHRLTQELGLSWTDRLWLTHVARNQQLPTPLTLLLSGLTLMHHVSEYGRSLSPRAAARALERGRRLHRQIFGEPATLSPESIADVEPSVDAGNRSQDEAA